MRSAVLRPVVLCVALVSLLPASLALSQGGGGTISGSVYDASGGAIPGATVTVKNLGTSAVRSTVTGASGGFTFPSLPVGLYDVTAELPGFDPTKAPNAKLQI